MKRRSKEEEQNNEGKKITVKVNPDAPVVERSWKQTVKYDPDAPVVKRRWKRKPK